MTFGSMQLKQECLVRQRKLDDMRTGAGFSLDESGLGFGIEADNLCRTDLSGSRLKCRSAVRYKNSLKR